MSDDSLFAVLARLEAGQIEISERLGRVEAEQAKFRSELNASDDRLMARFNNSEERILNRLSSIERDFQNTKNFLVGDALVSGGRWLDLEARVTKLEDGKSD